MTGLEGKAVVITGSGRGIGAACAMGVARGGASVVVNDLDQAEAQETVDKIKAAGGKAVACIADITDWDAAGRLIQTCIDSDGKIDGLVNNAALLQVALLEEFDPVHTRKMLDVNVLGSMHTAAHAVKPMMAQRSGSIVNVTSGAHMGNKTRGVYAATKGAVASMTYCWALELEEFGIRVNALSPLGRTRMLEVQEAYRPGQGDGAKRALAIQPPEANSPVVEYLLSDRSQGVTGQLVRIDKEELSIYVHPSIHMPPVVRESWSLDAVAEAFDQDLRSRLVPCGVMGVTGGEIAPVKSGFWNRLAKV